MNKYIVQTILLFLLNVPQSCDKIGGGGGYSYAQVYSTGSSMGNVIIATQTFKKQNPTMCPPDSLKFLTDGYDKDINGNNITTFYYVNYYYPEQETYITTFIDVNGEIGLIGIGNAITKIMQSVNRDITGSANDSVKNEFVRRILNPVKVILSKQ
jgi:hypothetical protein